MPRKKPPAALNVQTAVKNINDVVKALPRDGELPVRQGLQTAKDPARVGEARTAEVAGLLQDYGAMPQQVLAQLIHQEWLGYIRAMVQGGLTPTQAARSVGAAAVPPAALTRTYAWNAIYTRELSDWQTCMSITRRDIVEGIKDGIQIAMDTGDGGNVIKGWGEIGKICGLYAPTRQVITVDVSEANTIKQLAGMSDAELIALMNETRPAIDSTAVDVTKPAQSEGS